MKHQIAVTLFFFSFSVMGQTFHTEFNNNGITIKNSYPKGGQKYTDPDSGKEYVYVVFWTCITNGTASSLELALDFPNDSFIIPSSPNTRFNLYVPREEMTLEKESLFNYGLDIKSFLDENIAKPSSVRTAISPNDAYLFYTVVISNRGVNGPVRAGYELKNQDVVYTINGYSFNCGSIIAQKDE